jgi:hypothetical protein
VLLEIAPDIGGETPFDVVGEKFDDTGAGGHV